VQDGLQCAVQNSCRQAEAAIMHQGASVHVQIIHCRVWLAGPMPICTWLHTLQGCHMTTRGGSP
jgi:hypothetical protein